VEQMRKLAVHDENHVIHKDRIEHFAFQIKKQNLNAKDVMDYVNPFRSMRLSLLFEKRTIHLISVLLK